MDNFPFGTIDSAIFLINCNILNAHKWDTLFFSVLTFKGNARILERATKTDRKASSHKKKFSHLKWGKLKVEKSKEAICTCVYLKKKLKDNEKRPTEENNQLRNMGGEFKPQGRICLTTIIAFIILAHNYLLICLPLPQPVTSSEKRSCLAFLYSQDRYKIDTQYERMNE